jgi:Transglycosylase-like domain
VRRRLIAAIALTLATGCTPAQTRAWLMWHDTDPEAAQAWLASPEGQATLDDTDGPQFAEYLEADSRYGLAVWNKIARCESGGNWAHRPVTNSSGTYSGGLMIGHRWWPKFRGTEFALYPYQASKAEQILVAERIADAVGLDRAWQCWP